MTVSPVSLPSVATAAVISIRGGRRPGRRGAGFSGAGAADMGPLAIVPDELLSGIGEVGAMGGEEIESRAGKSARRMRAGTAAMILGVVGDPSGPAIVV